ncbi:MAG: HPr family phosphocarrier protein [Verrucomicrobiota bacterium]
MSHSAGANNSKIVREYVIQNRYGIHARPAAMLVKTASKFQADVTLEKGAVRVSGKSIMGLMTMEASCGAKIRIVAEGVDAEQALDEIERLFANKFYEE